MLESHRLRQTRVVWNVVWFISLQPEPPGTQEGTSPYDQFHATCSQNLVRGPNGVSATCHTNPLLESVVQVAGTSRYK